MAMGVCAVDVIRKITENMSLEEQYIAVTGIKEEVLWCELMRRQKEKDVFIEGINEAIKREAFK